MPFILSIIAALFSLGAAMWVIKKGEAERPFIARLLAFSSGIMIAVSFLHFLPEGYALNAAQTSWGFLLTILFLFSIENFTVMNSCSEFVEDCHLHHLSFFAFFALTLHSLIDGFNISVGFSIDGAVGINSVLAVMMHKFADGITLASLMKHNGLEKRKIFWSVLLMSAATPCGTLFSSALINSFNTFLPLLTGISAASFLYIATTEIIPHLHREKRISSPALLLAGYIFVFAVHLISGGEPHP